MIPRQSAQLARTLAREFKVVAIIGPRQSGKTTLAQAVFGDKPYVSLEELDQRRFAEEDPRRFLELYPYNCPFRPEIKEHLSPENFPTYVEREGIARVQVQLEPGDLYFFYTENIHEVPAIVGDQPRAVLAIFFAMSPDDDEIYVWA